MTTRQLLRKALFSTIVLAPSLVLASSAAWAQQKPGKPVADAKIDGTLVATIEASEQKSARGMSAPSVLARAKTLTVGRSGLVAVDLTAETDAEELAREVTSFGCTSAVAYGHVVSAQCPVAALRGIGMSSNVNFVHGALSSRRTGRVGGQGDKAMRANVVRAALPTAGAGVTVGVLSDSYDCLGGAAREIAANELPADVKVLKEGPCPASDEGRAMMQIINDVAPLAPQAFYSAFYGQADFAQGITSLKDAGAAVIVDDIAYFAEPFFQDGIVAQAIDDVVAAGAAYFSAAGNEGRKSYEQTFRPSGQTEPFYGGVLHDFDPGTGVDVWQSVTLPAGTTYLSFQWNDRYRSASGAPGSASDYDIFLCPAPSFSGCITAADSNQGADPIEVLGVINQTASPLTVYIALSRYSGASDNLLKYIAYNTGFVINEFDTASSALAGHPNAEGAEAVGAAACFETPLAGVNPALLEPYSSAGGTPIYFDRAGNAVAPIVRQKPEIVAPDGVNTTFFGQDISQDSDGYPNFFGTSAAAPHAAAVAALMKGAKPSTDPAEIYATLEATALDMGAPGVDFSSGHGFVRADAAVSRLLSPVVAARSAARQ